MTKQESGELTPANASSCGQCKTEASPPFLHYIKHRGVFRRLCTTCILRFNSQSFCPTCFSLYNPTTPLQDSTTPCSKCYSISHSSCIEGLLSGPLNSNNPNKLNNPSIPYVCPLCSSSPVFQVKKNKEIDKKSAAALLAAAKISYDSMIKAKVAAKAEAEKRSKEAWSTKKRAREAMEHVASIEERLKIEARGVVDGLGFGGNLSRIVGNVGERNLFGDGIRMDRVDNSSAVLASLNAVELNDKQGGKGNVLLSVCSMPIGENGVVSRSGSDGIGRQLVQVVDEKPKVVMGPYAQNNHPRDGNGGPFQ